MRDPNWRLDALDAVQDLHLAAMELRETIERSYDALDAAWRLLERTASMVWDPIDPAKPSS